MGNTEIKYFDSLCREGFYFFDPGKRREQLTINNVPIDIFEIVFKGNSYLATFIKFIVWIELVQFLVQCMLLDFPKKTRNL